MIQFATSIGNLLAGVSEKHHPMGNCVYAVRDGEEFVYIGQTVIGAWRRNRMHLTEPSPLGHEVWAHWPEAAAWRVEVCNFRSEVGTDLLEKELIRRYKPRVNLQYNTGRPRTENEEFILRHALLDASCRIVLDTGWPSFLGVALDLPKGEGSARASGLL